MAVYRRKNESVESLLRRFGVSVDKAEILIEAKERRFYEKPSDLNRRKKTAAKRRQKYQEQSRLNGKNNYKSS